MAPKTSRYIPSIDGLRAIAVTAVILYHLGVNWIPGGFLGVDLFFCISGYVITRQLLDSIERKSGLDLREFYQARIRRLFPALVFMLVGTLFIIAIGAPDGIRRYLTDLPYVLTGTENWHLVSIHQDYFASTGRPPLLQHIWSLGVEAQFYLFWPLILLVVLRRFGKKNVARISLGISALSGLVLFLYSISADHASSNRTSHIYFGTDTHSLGLFLGAALAVSWIPQNLGSTITDRAQDFVDGIGVFGLIGLLSTFLFINEGNAALYQIAFPLAAIFGCATITSLVHPASRFAPLIGSRPLLWIGERSYGIYLWHWVIFQISRPSEDLAGATWAINCARILIVIALADISLRWIEIPIRRGKLADWLRGMKYRTLATQKRQKILIVASVFVITLTSSGAAWSAWVQNDSIIKKNAALANEQPPPVPTLSADNRGKIGLWVTGDSIILGTHEKLAAKYPVALVNARVGRQIGELIQVVEQDGASLQKDPVVFDLGNNNHLTIEDTQKLFALFKNQPKIIVVNAAVPRGWRDDNNRIIRQVASNYSQATVVDWASISQGHPEYFAPDGIHLNDVGGNVYVGAISEALGNSIQQLATK
jgi:peptidoglycan/LPS O-acetylase OafA/YrhL